jgi:hypothetical protein
MTLQVRLLLGLLLLAPSHAAAQGAEGTLLDLARIKDGVASRRISSFDRTGGNNDRFENIPAGERRTLFQVEGAGIINHIWITIAPPPPALNRNDIILRMYWDGAEAPCVEAPLGAFFGQGWDESYPFVSLPLAAGPREGRGLVSYFAMPFATGARIEVENDTGLPIEAFYYYVDYMKLDRLPRGMGRFHASYNHELTEALPEGENEWAVLGPQGANTTAAGNYLIADIEGKGHYVGVNYYVHSPSPMWYGEGDDMIFIDGEPFPPSLHGTGTEDYFNAAWCPTQPFSGPYSGITLPGGPNWSGRVSLYRFHVEDPIHFRESILVTIEHGHANRRSDDISSTAYWYQVEPHLPFALAPVEERLPRPDR